MTKCFCLDSPFERMPINVNERCLDCPTDCGHNPNAVKRDGTCLICAMEWAAELFEGLEERLATGAYADREATDG